MKKEEELYRVLDKIFCERCGFRLSIRTSFREERDESEIQKSELEMREAARHVAEHLSLGRAEEPEPEEKKPAEKAAGSRYFGNSAGRKNGRNRGKNGREEQPVRRKRQSGRAVRKGFLRMTAFPLTVLKERWGM